MSGVDGVISSWPAFALRAFEQPQACSAQSQSLAPCTFPAAVPPINDVMAAGGAREVWPPRLRDFPRGLQRPLLEAPGGREGDLIQNVLVYRLRRLAAVHRSGCQQGLPKFFSVTLGLGVPIPSSFVHFLNNGVPASVRLDFDSIKWGAMILLETLDFSPEVRVGISPCCPLQRHAKRGCVDHRLAIANVHYPNAAAFEGLD